METVCYFQRDYITFLNGCSISFTQASENRGKASIESLTIYFPSAAFLAFISAA